MKLLLDIGNSRIKAGLADGSGILPLAPRAWRDEGPAAAWQAVLSGVGRPEAVYASNVAGEEIAAALQQWTGSHWRLAPRFVAVQRDFAGVRTSYDRPAQLGVDRWLAAVAGHALVRGAVCVIGGGTALTVDAVAGDGRHVGGLIAPGLWLMVKSLLRGTAQLELDRLRPAENFATNTADAISLGCNEAIAGLIARVAVRFAREVGDAATWLVTGGDAEAIAALSPIPLRVVPDLVLRGVALVAERDA